GAAETPIGASAGQAVTATIAQAMPPADARFVGGACLVGSRLTPIVPFFDIVVISTGTIDMQRLTLELNDGSHVGGPTVTFPQAGLTSLFGNTVIVGGTPRLFTVTPFAVTPFVVTPNITCGSTPWRSVSAHMLFRA